MYQISRNRYVELFRTIYRGSAKLSNNIHHWNQWQPERIQRISRMKKTKIAKIAVVVGLLFVMASGLIMARTSVFAASTIQLLMFNSNTSATSNTIYPHIEVKNTGSAAITLSSVTVRYYYTEDGTQSQNFWCDWSNAGTAHVSCDKCRSLSADRLLHCRRQPCSRCDSRGPGPLR